MEIGEKLVSLAEKVQQQKAAIETEEATKAAFVMPFISQVLGYDVFDPGEVVPEFTADFGTKKGEKIDYAIMGEGGVRILIECKSIGSSLNVEHASQLFRYFSTTSARIAVLTNGEQYQFFTDLDRPNMMDEMPFLRIDLTDLDSSVIPELLKMTKDVFDLDSIVSAAEELKYVGALKRVLVSQFNDPDDDWVRLLAARVYAKSITQKVREQFGGLVRKASHQFLADQVNTRLKMALGSQGYHSDVEEPAPQNVDATEGAVGNSDLATPKNGVVTTLEEMEGFQIVRAIACSEVSVERIFARDTKGHFGVLLDNTNRKPLVRLYFNNPKKKSIGVMGADKTEISHAVQGVAEIYQYASDIRAAVHLYDQKRSDESLAEPIAD